MSIFKFTYNFINIYYIKNIQILDIFYFKIILENKIHYYLSKSKFTY